MSQVPNIGSLVGKWTYRSFLNNPDESVDFNKLEFGRGFITVYEAPMGVFKGTIGDTGWSLDLNGSITYGDPNCIRFQGKGVVDGAEWIYDYVGYVIAPWPNGVKQVPAIAGSIVRTIPHPTAGGTAPAGVVNSWIALRESTD